MTRFTLLPALLSTVLTGCSIFPFQSASEAPPKETAASPLDFKLASGTFSCEAGLRVDVARNPATPNQMQINWQGRSYALARDSSASGLPRYEEARGGLVWIDLPWKGVLLDGRTHKPLASECTPTAA
ncbi:MAG: MliC family protein [Zoogloeaceae bacterium]|nr:MliC family protein [Zoogloeaceae bacterium]